MLGQAEAQRQLAMGQVLANAALTQAQVDAQASQRGMNPMTPLSIGGQIEKEYLGGNSGQPADIQGKMDYLRNKYGDRLDDAGIAQLAEAWQGGKFQGLA